MTSLTAPADAAVMQKLSPIGVDDSVREFGRSVLLVGDDVVIGGVQLVEGPPSVEPIRTGVVWDGFDGSSPPRRVIGTTDQEAFAAGRTASFGAQIESTGEALVVSQYNNAVDGEVWIIPRDGQGGRTQIVPPVFSPTAATPEGFGHSFAVSQASGRIVVGAPFTTDFYLQQGRVYSFQNDGVYEGVANGSANGGWLGLDVAVDDTIEAAPLATTQYWQESPGGASSPAVVREAGRRVAVLAGEFRVGATLQIDVSDRKLLVGSAEEGLALIYDLVQQETQHELRAQPLEFRFGAVVEINERYALVSSWGRPLRSLSVSTTPLSYMRRVNVFDTATGLRVAAIELPFAEGSTYPGFGESLALAGSMALIGAPGVDNGVGAAYLVDLDQFYLPGDFNGDQRIDNADLNLLLGHWGAVAEEVSAEWDGRPIEGAFVDNSELQSLLDGWGASRDIGPLVAVPEPTPFALLAWACVSTGARRVSRCDHLRGVG